MYKMQLDKMSNTALDKLDGAFDDLPTTSHADGKYRLRRYSRVQMSFQTMTYKILEGNKFTQSSEYNSFQGDVARSYENISDDIVKNYAFWELCSRFITTFKLPPNNVVEAHQMRVITLDDETPVAPEGVHQDGYDGICIACVERHNIEGGHLLVHRKKDSPPIANLALENGELAYINDRVLWHNATPLSRKDSSHNGYMDLFILTATNNVTS